MPFIDVPEGDGGTTIRCFFSKTPAALGVQPDAEFAELDPAFREPLAVGRPIESA